MLLQTSHLGPEPHRLFAEHHSAEFARKSPWELIARSSPYPFVECYVSLVLSGAVRPGTTWLYSLTIILKRRSGVLHS